MFPVNCQIVFAWLLLSSLAIGELLNAGKEKKAILFNPKDSVGFPVEVQSNKSSQQEKTFDLEKRFDGRFTFGLGKRNDTDKLSNLKKLKTKKHQLNSKPGKDVNSRFAFGLEKRHSSNYPVVEYSTSIDKMQHPQQFSFGLGQLLKDHLTFDVYNTSISTNTISDNSVIDEDKKHIRKFIIGLEEQPETRFTFGIGKRSTNLDQIVSKDKKHSHQFNFGLGKRVEDRFYFDLDRKPLMNIDYSSPSKDKRKFRPFNFGLGKRSDNRFAFGLGKKSLLDNLTVVDPTFREEKRISHQFSFGLGKRPDNRFSFGLGKKSLLGNLTVVDPNFGEEKRISHQFSFGLGKRPDNRFSFGLGKKSLLKKPIISDSSLKEDKRFSPQFSFGLGKRTDSSLSLSLSKRDSKEQLVIPSMASKRMKRNTHQFSFGLGKRRENRFGMGYGNMNALSPFNYAFGLGNGISLIKDSFYLQDLDELVKPLHIKEKHIFSHKEEERD
ncbi:uncharacterized protein LOC143244733 [Tachypleus tridentatus]|uniref:uncharacterized protein LOC143244733 n=1 Tax=Tachypleus tridentatus TaxID=6853 RepID=UPI003FD2906A